MNTKTEKIPFIMENGTQGMAKITYQAHPAWLEIETSNKSISTEGIDIFQCLNILRTQLEQEGIKLLCNGCDRTFGVNEFLSQMESGLYGVMGSSVTDAKEKYVFEPNLGIDYAPESEQRAYQLEISKVAFKHGQEYFKTKLLEIIRDCKRIVDKSERDSIIELLEKYELKAAVEKLCVYLIKQKKGISRELFGKITYEGGAIGLDDSIITDLGNIIKD